MAILLVGKGETEDERIAFEKDAKDMKRMITDPRVMGIRSACRTILFYSYCMKLYCIQHGMEYFWLHVTVTVRHLLSLFPGAYLQRVVKNSRI